MEPIIIVMITLLALPNGDNGVHIKPFASVAACAQEAEVEATDPFVAHVECSELINGNLTLNFKQAAGKPSVENHSNAAGG